MNIFSKLFVLLLQLVNQNFLFWNLSWHFVDVFLQKLYIFGISVNECLPFDVKVFAHFIEPIVDEFQA